MSSNNPSPAVIQGQLTNTNIPAGEAPAALLSAVTFSSSEGVCEPWKADVPHLSCTQQGGLCAPENSQPGLCATAHPSHGLTHPLISLHTKDQNIPVIPSPLTGHHQGTTGSFHLYRATFKKQISTYRNRKENPQKRKKVLFIIKGGNLNVILHNGNTKAGSLHKTITQDLLFPSQEVRT